MTRLQLGSSVKLSESFSKRDTVTRHGSSPHNPRTGLPFALGSEAFEVQAGSWGAHVREVLKAWYLGRVVRSSCASAFSSRLGGVRINSGCGSGALVASATWTMLRMSVVRRDRYRCRGCDKTGDEITLRVFPMRGDLSLAKEMITLCTRCHGVVIDTGLTANGIPDFLRQLWYFLHHAHEDGYHIPGRTCLHEFSFRPPSLWHLKETLQSLNQIAEGDREDTNVLHKRLHEVLPTGIKHDFQRRLARC